MSHGWQRSWVFFRDLPPAQLNMKATKATRAKKAIAPKAEIGQPMQGRDILVRALEREGVEVVFAYPGGASMEIHQALDHSHHSAPP
jgi:hypothetical protein